MSDARSFRMSLKFKEVPYFCSASSGRAFDIFIDKNNDAKLGLRANLFEHNWL